MKKKFIAVSGLGLVFAPFVVLAQTTGGAVAKCAPGAAIVDIQTFLCKIGDILNAVLPILIALGVVYFVWGVVTFVISDDEEAKTKGRDRIVMGIIGLAVIIGVWGLVAIVRNTFGLRNDQSITLPTVPY